MQDRVRLLNDRPVRAGARYVLYWSQMNRRAESNHALAHAAGLANGLGLPLLVYEGLTCSYPYANDRLHTFILEAVPETARAVRGLGAGYCFYIRRRASDPDDVLYRLAADAAALVTDDYPTFVARRHNARVPARLEIACQAVDSSCVVPMNLFPRREYAAYTLRPKLRKLLEQYLRPVPAVRLKRKWEGPLPGWSAEVEPDAVPALVASCDIDHGIPPAIGIRGGRSEARKRLRRFLRERLGRYARDRNEPSLHATSELSPYLHFGQIPALDVALAVRDEAAARGLDASEFLDELIVRRELAFNFCRHVEDPQTLDALPPWALETLRRHADDPRNPCYSLERLESAETYDPLWNATQKELLLRGRIHGYYRMYWGKKIIEWSPTHEAALGAMVYLHDRYSLDGRDPNTYANVLWCFGLHDRPWFERPIFGTVRYMSLEGMKRKTDTAAYIREIADVERAGRA